MFDEFMQEFLTQFPSDADLRGTHATLMLTMFALFHPLTQKRIECRFAALRRLLLSKGGMTWKHDLESASSDWVMARQRTMESWVRKLQDTKFKTEGIEQPDSAPVFRAHVRGPFKVWMSEWLASKEARAIPCIAEKMNMGIAAYNSIKEEGGKKVRRFGEER